MIDVDGQSEVIQHRYNHPKFQIRNLTKVSDAGVPILTGINLDVPKGIILGVIGPSGSGKSTFLRALNRLWEPPSRTVFFDDSDICDLDVLSLRRKVGMLFQLPALFEGLSILPFTSLPHTPSFLLLYSNETFSIDYSMVYSLVGLAAI